MKKLAFLFSFIAVSTLSFSQQHCNATSNTFLYDFNQYYGFWDDYYQIRPVVKIKMNFVVLQDQNGNNNYKISDTSRLKNIINQVNNTYMYNQPPSDTILLNVMGTMVPVPFLPSTKVQFHLDSIYFYQDSALYFEDNIDIENHHINQNPSATDEVNVYIKYNGNFNISGVAQPADPHVFMYFAWLDTLAIPASTHDNAFANVLGHEFGHFFDLFHTYMGMNENLPENDPEYLGDIFNYGTLNNFPHVSYWNCPTDSNYIPNDTVHNFSCTNNIMGGTSNQVYFSPMQIYRIHKRLSMDDRFFKFILCEDYGPLDPILITDIEKWDFKLKLFNPIRIISGGDLELTCELEMNLNTKIIVETGARLNLNGGKITSTCGFWDGIELHGDPSLHQTFSSNPTQPIFSSSTGATVENAAIALKTYSTDTQGNINWNSFGGVINCSETHFVNNWRSAAFMKYQNYNPNNGSLLDYIGSFEKCTFNWDSNYIDSNWIPQHHISAWGTDGLTFNGNTFKNDFFGNKMDINRLIGINTIDASIYVDRFVTNQNDPMFPGPITASTFQDLNTGIKASSPSSLSWNTIKNTTFENNHIGAYILGSDLSELTANEFLIPEGFVNNEGGQGIRIEGSSSLNIEGNTFSHSGNTNGTGGTVGIYSINADPLAPTTNSIYRNTFTNLQRSVQLSNGTGPFGGPINPNIGNTMTQIDCNTFQDSAVYYNFYTSIYKFSGALGIQGECLTATDPDYEQGPQVNLFQGFYDETQNQWQTINFGTNFQYNSYPYNDVGIDTLTWFNNGTQYLDECGGFTSLDFNQACPNNLSQGGPFGPMIQPLQEEEQLAMTSFLSGQDEEDLITMIQSNANAYSKEQALLDKAPYLTNAVLIAMVNSDLPNFRKNNVLQPHYPVSDEVIESMLNTPFSITPYILRDALVSGAGVRENLLIQFFKDENQPNWAIAEVAEANSPLSDNELLAILNRSETLEPYRLWKFLQWNTPLSAEVMNTILGLDPPTADWVINKINASTFIAGDPKDRVKKNKNALQLLEEQLQQIKSKKWYYLNKEIRNKLAVYDYTEVQNILDNDQTLESAILKLGLSLEANISDLQNQINDLIDYANDLLERNPKDEKGIELINVCNYYSLLYNAQSIPGELLNLEESAIDQLESYSEQGKSLSGKAKGLLNFYGASYQYHFMEPLKFPGKVGKKSMAVEVINEEEEKLFVVYPNPNNGNFILSGQIPENKTQVELRILDLTGRIVKLKSLSGSEIREVISLNEAKGTYLYEVRSVNEVLGRGKIIINQ